MNSTKVCSLELSTHFLFVCRIALAGDPSLAPTPDMPSSPDYMVSILKFGDESFVSLLILYLCFLYYKLSFPFLPIISLLSEFVWGFIVNASDHGIFYQLFYFFYLLIILLGLENMESYLVLFYSFIDQLDTLASRYYALRLGYDHCVTPDLHQNLGN